MKKQRFISYAALLIALCAVGGCSRCEVEPIVEENQKLIVPPNFGKKPTSGA